MSEVRCVFRGKRMNQRMVAMLTEAEKILKTTLVFTQGSYNQGVAASAGTHDGGGAVDVRAIDLSVPQRAAVVRALRKVGFAAWLRTPTQGKWPYHIHAIAIGDQDLSPAAAFQVAEYHRKRNGLANRGNDDGPPGYYGVTWELYQKSRAVVAPSLDATPKPATGDDDMSQAQYDALMKEIQATRADVRAYALWQALYGLETEDERAQAQQAFDDARAAGKSIQEAKAAAVAVLQGLVDAVKKSQAAKRSTE
jgi:hypothetical protein